MIDSDLLLITHRNGTRVVIDRANTAVMILPSRRRRGERNPIGDGPATWRTIAHIDPIRVGGELRIVTRPHGDSKAPAASFRCKAITGIAPLSTLELRDLGVTRITWQRTR